MTATGKRGRAAEEAELKEIRERLLERVASVMHGGETSTAAALEPSPSSTLLDLGVTSASAAALKGWVFKELEAEITTFELMKTPLNELFELIAQARTQEVGCFIPPVPVQ